ncbi:MAG: Photosystem II reaction centre I protein (PSII 4.8 kDa protein) [Rhodobacteraceae bacterium HLUCCO07]|nr:MAG: Photosystem II reaction centre I protein (PSII 4.8 kDa protein) [Rhodobacteraceae bacterium HLUCCO07]
MSRMDYLRNGGTPFDGFLYADLGQDRAGNTVSVLSALARLGLDPWDEAADLAALSREGAYSRLGGVLARFYDVPSLGRDPGATIPRLVDLLPKAPDRKTAQGLAPPAGANALGFGPILAVLLVVLFLVQTFIFGSDGTGD